MTGPSKAGGRTRASIGAVRSPEAHAAILAAATQILLAEGYSALTFDAVARRAGSSKPTIYRWWPNKAALIMEVYERLGEAALQVPPADSLEAELAALLRRLWAWWRETRAGEALRSLIAEAQLTAAGLDDLRAVFVPRRKALLQGVFARALARGEIAAGADVEAATAMLVGVCWLQLLTDDIADLAAVDRHVALVCAALTRSAPTAQGGG